MRCFTAAGYEGKGMGRKAGVRFFFCCWWRSGGACTMTYKLHAHSPACHRGCDRSRARPLTDNSAAPFKFNLDTKAISDPGAIANAAARVEPSVVTIDTEYRPRYPLWQRRNVRPEAKGCSRYRAARVRA